MRAKKFLKSLLTICALFVGLSLNATLGEMTIWGYTTYDGEALSDIEVSCPNSKEKSLTTTSNGFYQFTRVSDRSTITFSSADFGEKKIQVFSSNGTSQHHDCDFSSSSSN